MKRMISLLLALIIAAAVMPAVMADEIELEEIYEAYGLGEEIFICGTVPAGVPAVFITISNVATDQNMYMATAMSHELRDGIYIAVGRNWELGEYMLMVSYTQD